MTETEVHARIDAVWRIESARLIAGLMRIVRDVGVAEELAQDALVSALEQWPAAGVPDNPGAWLMATAKHRALDRVRRKKILDRKHEELVHEVDRPVVPDMEGELDDAVGDDLLRLVFIACHPVLSPDARAALTLRLLGGLTTDEIARAFLSSEPTIQQRIVRAKKTLADAHVPFEVPRREELAARISSVLEVVYLIFNEGYAATAGEDLMRPALCEEALRLGRVLAGLLPDEPEVHGLVAMMELHGSRAKTRTERDGTPVLLADQKRSRWDQAAIGRGAKALERALAVGRGHGPYTLQAAISAAHARAPTFADTDWAEIAGLYRQLAEQTGSPIVELNRAVAVSMAEGPATALPILEALEERLADYHLFSTVRGDLLDRLGRGAEARMAFERAASLTKNEREKKLLLDRAEKADRSS